jgi:tetratricopeptide (TPR) repeat protein
VDALEIHLTPQEAAQLAERPIADIRAQECYLRARNEIWSFLPSELGRAMRHLEAGLELVGDNVLLYQGLGEAYFQYVNAGVAVGQEEEYIAKSDACADKIFSLEPDSPHGHLVRARAQLSRGDIHGCGKSFRRVLNAFPNDVPALWLYSHVLAWLVGKPEGAAPLAARLTELDPLSAHSLIANISVPLFSGRFADALEPARRVYALDPITPVWRGLYVTVLMYNGRLDEAEALSEGFVFKPDSDMGTWWIGITRAAWRKDRAEVLRLANGPYLQTALWDQEVPWLLADVHAAVGAKDEALHWLDVAIANGMINYPFLSQHDRCLDNVRGDPRFARAMDKAEREWERFEV